MTAAVGPGDVARFRELIRARTGMAFEEKRSSDLEWAIRGATGAAGLSHASELFDLLEGSEGLSEAFERLISALSVSETHFFRDPHQMEQLRTSILPELVARRRRDRRLRLWSAGCSTGEEPYTLAILLRELVPDLADWDVLILGTDINRESIERAREGIYRQWSFREMPASALTSHVIPKGSVFEVVPTIRDMVTFAQLNLAQPLYPSRGTNTYAMDLILCRNVLLYFDEAQTHEVVARLWSSLEEEGWLLVSPVDSTLPAFEELPSEGPGTGIYRNVRRTQTHDEVGREEAPIAVAEGDSQGDSKEPLSAASSDGSAAVEGSDAVATDARKHYDAVLRAWTTAGEPEARKLLKRAVAKHPLDAPLRYLHGLVLLEDGDVAGALHEFRRSTYSDPDFAPGHLGQGTAFARGGLHDRALVALETAARLVADVDPREALLTPDGLSAAEVLEMVVAERVLIASAGVPHGVVHG
jgi:chemotaxis protein methyltransferase CheR